MLFDLASLKAKTVPNANPGSGEDLVMSQALYFISFNEPAAARVSYELDIIGDELDFHSFDDSAAMVDNGLAITLHAGPGPNYPALSTVEYTGFDNTPYIRLEKHKGFDRVMVEPVYHFSGNYSFSMYIACTGKRETFEWRRMTPIEAYGVIEEGNTGWILQGEWCILATWEKTNSEEKGGKVCFRGEAREGFGREWEVLVVLSLMVVVEREY